MQIAAICLPSLTPNIASSLLVLLYYNIHTNIVTEFDARPVGRETSGPAASRGTGFMRHDFTKYCYGARRMLCSSGVKKGVLDIGRMAFTHAI